MSNTAVLMKEENQESAGSRACNTNINMVTNIKDHISCTKPMESYNSQDSKVGILSFPCDFDHMYASMTEGMVSPKEKNECKHLKEICLHHLDLIQQQSEIIAKQEKQILSLRQENDTLKQRLHRMDRRVVLQKPATDVDSADADTTSTRSPSRSTAQSPISPRSLDHPKRPRSRSIGDYCSDAVCHSPVQWEETSAQRVNSEDGGASVSSGCELRDDSSSTTASQRSALHAAHTALQTASRKSRTKRTVSSCSKENSAGVASRGVSTDPPPAKKAKKSGASVEPPSPAPAILTTTRPYHSVMGDMESIWSVKEEPDPEREVNGDLLEIPQWRLKVYTSLYSMEGTENLDDEVFLKRHQRLEIDERRRKRWDVQRIREQRHVEKLRQRELAANNALGGSSGPEASDDDHVSSLWPSPDEAEYLEVADELPVAAFGLPILKFQPSEFSLPWLQPGRRQSGPAVSKPIRRRRSAPGSTLRRKRIVRPGPRPSLHLTGRKSEASERK